MVRPAITHSRDIPLSLLATLVRNAKVGDVNILNGERLIKRVLVVGLDGATWDILRPLATAGRLPNMQRIMQNGTHARLQSTIPPATPAAWTSMFTGKNPGRHGIYGFQKLDPQTYEFDTVRTHRHREKALWQLLSEQGKRAIMMDVPFTYPPQPFNGLMITGYGTPRTPETVFTYPADLRAILPSELQDEIRLAVPKTRFDRSQRFIDEWAEVMEGRRRLLSHLLTQQPWDFFMVVFSITDNMAHVFWTYADPAHPNYYRPEAEQFREAFYHSYEQCDRLLGELSDRAGAQTTTLVISDHGFGSVRPRQYLFHRLLEGGYLVAGSTGERQWLPTGRLLRVAVKTYSRFPKLRELVKGLRPGSRGRLISTLRTAGMMPEAESIDYERSKVILSSFGLQLWINEQGRFAQGIVRREQRAELIDELSEYLLSDSDPISGQPIIRTVYRGRDVFEGPFVDGCPDLVIEYNNLFNSPGPAGQRNGLTEGGHIREGIFLAQGPVIGPGEIEEAHLVDLAPTILHLLDLPVPPDMDGSVLESMLVAPYKEQNPIRFADKPARSTDVEGPDPYSAEQDAELRDQFRQLGYL